MNEKQFQVAIFIAVACCAALLIFVPLSLNRSPMTTASASTNTTDYFALSCSTLQQMVNDKMNLIMSGANVDGWNAQTAQILLQIMQLKGCTVP